VASRDARRPGELRGQIRAELDASARQRTADGAIAATQATGRLESRARELLRASLETEWARSDRAAAAVSALRSPPDGLLDGLHPGPDRAEAQVVASGATGGVSGLEGRVERVLALVERIQHFVRSGRPSLALTLRGGLPGRLELRRDGPGTISLRLSSSRPPSALELGELRQALEARGLSVRTMDLVPLTASARDACSPCP
jgi:hypothetical protein